MQILNYSILAKLQPRSLAKLRQVRTSIIGRTYGHLTVYALVGCHIRDGVSHWLCRCSCGNWSIVNRGKLGQKRTTSCGCRSAVQRTHGMRQTRVYHLWVGMLTRVRNPRTRTQHNYIGRGIQACGGLHKFENFYALLGNAPPKQSVDRIDNNGHYSCGLCKECLSKNWPMNVKWSTSKEQNRNRRDNLLVTIGSETKCLAEWVESSGVEYATAFYRLKHNWTPEEAFGFKEPPSRKGNGGRPSNSPSP